GGADFSPVARSIDAVRLHAATGNFDFEALASILQSPGPLGTPFADINGPSHSGVELYGLLARWTADPLFRIEAYALARMSRWGGGAFDGSRFQLARLSGELYTGSIRVFGDARGWTYGVEGAYQLGTADSLQAGGADIRAFAAAAHVSKSFDTVALSPTLRVSGSYASGDDNGSTYKQFDPILADPQRFHGQMDLFAWSNEMDIAGRAQIVPFTDTTFGVEYRWARMAESTGEWVGSYLTTIGSVRPPQGQNAIAVPSGSTLELGHELDVVFAWRPWVPLEVRLGWSGLLLGDAAKTIMAARQRGNGEPDGSYKPPTTSQYAYAQATLTIP
ncbi:MAG TPA: alginate export family protein, partial [Labilithrix sp.]